MREMTQKILLSEIEQDLVEIYILRRTDDTTWNNG
jgi:hypothetical protein